VNAGPVVEKVTRRAAPAERDLASYSVLRDLSRACPSRRRALAFDHRPDLTDTAPAALIGRDRPGRTPRKIV